MTSEFPTQIHYGYVAARYLLALGDTLADADDKPDALAPSGSIKFRPYAGNIAADGPPPVGVLPQIVTTSIDADGDMVDPAGAKGVWLITGTYSVSFAFTGVTIPPFDITVTEAHTKDAPLYLSKQQPLIPGPTEVFVVNKQVYEETLAARDAAIEVQADVESSASDAAAAAAAAAAAKTAAEFAKTSAQGLVDALPTAIPQAVDAAVVAQNIPAKVQPALDAASAASSSAGTASQAKLDAVQAKADALQAKADAQTIKNSIPTTNDPIVAALVPAASASATSTALGAFVDSRLSPQAVANAVANAAHKVDLLGLSVSKRGLPGPFSSGFGESATYPYKRDSSGRLRLQRGTRNWIPSSNMAGAAVGVIGSGGAWPTGWAITTSASNTIVYEILSVSANTLRVHASRPANATGITGFGIRTAARPGYRPSAANALGGWAASATIADVSHSATVKQYKLALSVYNNSDSSLASEPNDVVQASDATRRMSTWTPDIPSTQSMDVTFNVEFTGTITTAWDVVFDITNPQLEDAKSQYDVTDWVASQRFHGEAAIPVIAGSYSVFCKGPNGGRWFDTTVTGNAGYSLVDGDGVLPVDTIYAFTPPLTIAQKDAYSESIAPTNYQKPTFYNTDQYRYNKKQMRKFTHQNDWGIAEGVNKRARMRFEVRPDDVTPYNEGSTNQRSELVHIGIPAGNVEPITVPFDTDVWVSMAVMVEADPVADRPWRILGQWHTTPDPSDSGQSPALHFTVTDTGAMQLTSRSDVNAVTPAGNAPGVISSTLYNEPNFPFGQWVRYVYRARFSQTGGGQIQLWRNGVEQFNKSAKIGYNDAVGPYFQFGAYLPLSATNRFVVHYDHVEWGTVSLLDRVTNPIPAC